MSITLDIAGFFKALARALRSRCPDENCSGRLKGDQMDDNYRVIYTCDCCGKEWV